MSKSRIVVVGNGMVGHKFLACLFEQGGLADFEVVTFCEEPQLAYDRVGLTSFFEGKSPEDLSLVEEGYYQRDGLTVHLGQKVDRIDRTRKVVISDTGTEVAYDKLVMATGSVPFVPPVRGRALKGVHVYRTMTDVEAIKADAVHAQSAVVLGGGLLGLEAANAVHNLGLKSHVLQLGDRLMNVQVDAVGGDLLRRKIEALGVQVHLNATTDRIEGDADGRAQKVVLADGQEIPAEMVIFSCGIKPRDELARDCDLEVGPRGGIVIDSHCRTSDPDIYAIGECALWQGRIFGLVAPGYDMAKVAAADLLAQADAPRFEGADMSTKLKLMGVDVASFGDALGQTVGCRRIVWHDQAKGVFKRINLSPDGTKLIGGILVGDASDYGMLLQMTLNDMELPEDPGSLIAPASEGGVSLGVDALPDSAVVCSCHGVTKGDINLAVVEGGCTKMSDIKAETKACTGCGGCAALSQKVLNAALEASGVEVNDHLCEHFAYSRQGLYSIVRTKQVKTYADLHAAVGSGSACGCETCKPAVASILASCWNEHVLEPQHAPLQETNDYFMANMQRDGTYSVVPRMAGGEVTPDGLIAIGQIAKKYDLYTKITGGQRVDLFGARAEELPLIWEALIAAGFETGHAYGKSLRTVKSCVGSTWCRYGVQDSVGLAIELENRYKGLRTPHKIKGAVSGCTRECAEAQGKDIGVIATDKGWNLYVCGNGGMKPRHADLIAQDLDKDTLFQYIDRFLMFYVRTADKLMRTSTWMEELEGGLDYLKSVIIDDKLDLCETLEAEMALVIDTYQCEWKTAVENPEVRKRFRSFVNTDTPDGLVQFVEQRDQKRPAYLDERTELTISAGR